MPLALEIHGLRKSYAGREVVAGVDLQVDAGEVFALLGPNGAGKTTTVEICEGYRHRDAGEVRVLGEDPADATAAWRRRIGVVLQTSGDAFTTFTVTEVVASFAQMYPGGRRAPEAVELVGLTEHAGQRVGKLSGGQRRRVDIACALVGRPELVFLDEPTTGLDPVARRQTWDLVKGLHGSGTTVLLTTHYLEEAEALADRVGVITDGRLVAVATPSELGGRSTATATISLALTHPPGSLAPPLDAATWRDGRLTLHSAHPTAAVLALREQLGLDELPGLVVSRPTLEDVYLQLVRDPEHQATTPDRSTSGARA